MKKIFLLMAFAGILGSASAATINSTILSKAIISVYGTGDEKKEDKKKDKEKAGCKKDAKCAGKEKACCKKKEGTKETTNTTKK